MHLCKGFSVPASLVKLVVDNTLIKQHKTWALMISVMNLLVYHSWAQNETALLACSVIAIMMLLLLTAVSKELNTNTQTLIKNIIIWPRSQWGGVSETCVLILR